MLKRDGKLATQTNPYQLLRMRFLTRHLPRLDPQSFAKMWWVRPFAAQLLKPHLWKWRREPVARAAAVGAFFAFVTPLAQIPLSLGCALLFRMHLPTAATATFINNPLTFGPVYYAAYRVGAAILGEDGSRSSEEVAQMLESAAETIGQQAFQLGPALIETMLGATIFGVFASVAAYWSVRGYWHFKLVRRARRILQLRRGASV